MKIKAYQVAPEYQESPMSLLDECLEGLEIYGNRNYIRRTSDAEVALKHFASTVNEIVGYCFEPPATQSAIWP